MTLVGGMIITFIYAVVGIFFFRSEFEPGLCQGGSGSLWECTQTIGYQGTRMGIVGLSGIMREVDPTMPEYPFRILYDVSYFLVIGVMLLNVIVGLIVDAFGALRAKANSREELL